MGNILTEKRLFSALSDVFVDNVVDYDHIAKVASEHDVRRVEHAFFELVAPVCAPNMMTPTPTVWEGFDTDSLWDLIDERRKKIEKNNLALLDKARTRYLRKRFSSEWNEIRKRIEAYKSR